MTPHPSHAARVRARNAFVDTLGADFISARHGFDSLNPVVKVAMKDAGAEMLRFGVTQSNASIYVALNACRWYWNVFQHMHADGE